MGVGVKKTNVEMGVVDGSGVNVFLGVEVIVVVGVNVGAAVMVCMAAASAVNLINALMSSELRVGAGIGVAGTHARINARAAKQTKRFLACECAIDQFDFFIKARSLEGSWYRRLFIANDQAWDRHCSAV